MCEAKAKNESCESQQGAKRTAGCAPGNCKVKRCLPILGVLAIAITLPLLAKKMKASCPCGQGEGK